MILNDKVIFAMDGHRLERAPRIELAVDINIDAVGQPGYPGCQQFEWHDESTERSGII